ncbi:MAG TPA: efflux RND transporter periplasmic adaptor subunit [Rudaea sp.]|nr:efflux RND transporter periplasmic adaptor subunit [Rudaea sp.]
MKAHLLHIKQIRESRSNIVRCTRIILAAASVVSLAACSSAIENHDSVAAKPQDVTLAPAQRQRVHVYTVTAQKYQTTIQATGIVDFDNDHAISVIAPISGPVSRLLVSLGDQVKKGQALAQVESPDFSAAVNTYRKSLAAARTARRLADLDADLLKHHGVSQREATQAASDAISAESDRDTARQALVALNIPPATIEDIGKGRSVTHLVGSIRAPLAGTVVEKSIAPGQLLQAGATPCFTVADLSRVWVNAQIFGGDVAAVSTGDSAEIETGTNAGELAGKVTHVAAIVDADTRAVTARIAVDNPDDVLKKHMYVRVRIRSQMQHDGLLVPVSAILRDAENLPFVYVARSDGSYARRRVTLGQRTADQYAISAGLKVADRVVTDGGLFVQFMQSQ